jgi:cryptochrome
MPAKYIYEPWKAPDSVQTSSGVKIGKDYPLPIVDHATESKANMSKMAAAYAVHNDAAKGSAKGSSKGSAKAPAKVASSNKKRPAAKDAPAKKKTKVQQKLKL